MTFVQVLQITTDLSLYYGHTDDKMGVPVKIGQTVTPGQVIAYIGMTGNTTGPHLHFETRISGIAQNPRTYLPAY